jgi:hypothetical protein
MLHKLWRGPPGRAPWSVADALVGHSRITMRLIWLSEERVQGDPRGPGGPPYWLVAKRRYSQPQTGPGRSAR